MRSRSRIRSMRMMRSMKGEQDKDEQDGRGVGERMLEEQEE